MTASPPGDRTEDRIGDLIRAAERLVDAVTYDVCGLDGRGGNGGLVSTETIRACDTARLALARVRAGTKREEERP